MPPPRVFLFALSFLVVLVLVVHHVAQQLDCPLRFPSRSVPRRRFWQYQQRPSRLMPTRSRYSSVQVLHLRNAASNCLSSSCSAHSSVRRRPVAFSHSSASRSDFMKAGSYPPRISAHHKHSPSSSSFSPSNSTAQSAHGLAANLSGASTCAIIVFETPNLAKGNTLGSSRRVSFCVTPLHFGPRLEGCRYRRARLASGSTIG